MQQKFTSDCSRSQHPCRAAHRPVSHPFACRTFSRTLRFLSKKRFHVSGHNLLCFIDIENLHVVHIENSLLRSQSLFFAGRRGLWCLGCSCHLFRRVWSWGKRSCSLGTRLYCKTQCRLVLEGRTELYHAFITAMLLKLCFSVFSVKNYTKSGS